MPAAESRPTIVSISGRPAATSEPNASSMMPSVTGQEMTSDLSIAERLAALKSDHMPAAPVRLTTTALVESPCRVPLSLSAAATISLGFFAAPAWTIAVWPSREIDSPGAGETTVRTALLVRSVCSTRVIADLNAGELTVSVGEYTTVMSP